MLYNALHYTTIWYNSLTVKQREKIMSCDMPCCNTKPKRGPSVRHVNLCADEVLNTRDFCGNESEAIADYCADHNLLNSMVFADCVMLTVNQLWNKSRTAAGVKAV